MAKRVCLTEAKARFSAIVDEVLHENERYVVERRGRAVAAIVPVEELERIEATQRKPQPAGALALVGAWADVDDAEIDALLREVYDARGRDTGRPVAIEA